MTPKRSPLLVAAAFGFSILVPLLGYFHLGWFYALIFLVGYVGGFVLCGWPRRRIQRGIRSGFPTG